MKLLLIKEAEVREKIQILLSGSKPPGALISCHIRESSCPGLLHHPDTACLVQGCPESRYSREGSSAVIRPQVISFQPGRGISGPDDCWSNVPGDKASISASIPLELCTT